MNILFRIIIDDRLERLRKTIRQTIEALFEEYIHALPTAEQNRIKLALPWEVFTNYFAGSLLGMLTWWLEEARPYSPEEMTEMFRQLFFNGASETLGVQLG